MEILVNVSGQRLKVESNFKNFVSGSQRFVKFSFNLSNDWNDLTVFAQFKQKDEIYNKYLDDENCVFLPAEIVPGTCTMSICGTGSDTIGTTNCLTLTIDDNSLVRDAESMEVSTSLYMQLVDEVRKYEPKDGSIKRKKLAPDVESVLKLADDALTKSIYDRRNLETDIFEYAQRKADEGKVLKTKSGTAITISDAASSTIRGLVVYGNTDESGNSVGDDGKITINVYANGHDPQHMTIDRSELLPLRSAGDVKDTIEVTNYSGKMIRRVNENFTELLNPIEVPLTDAEVQAILSLSIYDSETTVEANNTELAVTYIADTVAYLNDSKVSMKVINRNLVFSLANSAVNPGGSTDTNPDPTPGEGSGGGQGGSTIDAEYIRKVIEETYILS